MGGTPSSEGYQTYRGLPPLAGLTTFEEATRPGLSVDEAVARLKRFHYAFKRLHEIFTARITAEPIYELKTAFAHHAYLCSEQVEAFRKRVGEMREPPLGLDVVPDLPLEVFFDEILATPTTLELLVGIEAAFGSLDMGLVHFTWETNPLTDAPSVRVCRFARVDLFDMIDFHRKAIACLVDSSTRAKMDKFIAALNRSINRSGLVSGVVDDGEWPVERYYSKTPYVYDPIPRRDERYQDLDNQGVNAEAFLYDPDHDARSKSLMMLFKRLREIDVPEMMASIITQTKGKPWGYYRDMTRQLWDEARHAMMGEVGFVAQGVDWTKARITHNWSLRLNTECTPLERHAVLYFIEQGLMPKTGKKYEWEVANRSGLPLMATIQDFDWADEVLHASIGREWYIPQLGTWKEALAFGDACWSRVLSNWAEVRDQGLTEHANWWPDIYLQACQTWGIEPDPKVLAFHVTYEGKRADLKAVGASD